MSNISDGIPASLSPRRVWLPLVGMFGSILVVCVLALGLLAYACYAIVVRQQGTAISAQLTRDLQLQAQLDESSRQSWQESKRNLRRYMDVPGIGAALILVESEDEIDLERVMRWSSDFKFDAADTDERWERFGKALRAAAARQPATMQSQLQQAAETWDRKLAAWKRGEGS